MRQELEERNPAVFVFYFMDTLCFLDYSLNSLDHLKDERL